MESGLLIGLGYWLSSPRLDESTEEESTDIPPKPHRARRRTSHPHLDWKMIYTEAGTCSRSPAGAAFGVGNTVGTLEERPPRSIPQPKRDDPRSAARGEPATGAGNTDREFETTRSRGSVSLRDSRGRGGGACDQEVSPRGLDNQRKGGETPGFKWLQYHQIKVRNIFIPQ